jgi:hypothetical protein
VGAKKGGGQSVTTVGLWLLTAHLIGDFPLQPDWIAKHKTENKTRLYIHSMVHALLVIPIGWYLFPESVTQQFVFVFWIAGTHMTIDFRRWFDPKESWGDNAQLWVWLNDQILHLVSLSLAIPVAELGLWA